LEKKRQRMRQKNSGVAITGLPLNVDKAELADFVTRFAGVIKKNDTTREEIVRLSPAEDGKTMKALVVFFRPESVQQAINIIGGMEYAPGFPLEVKAEKKKKTGEGPKKKDKRVKHYDQEKELDWEEEEEKLHVIVKGFFTLEEVREGGLDFFDELEQELREELEKLGPVKSIKVFRYNPEGVVAVKFEDSAAAIRCVDQMEGRFFAGRQLACFYYDGFTNYEVKETDEDRDRRIAKFGDWLGKE
jgi:HIV Tat-specific factor 1